MFSLKNICILILLTASFFCCATKEKILYVQDSDAFKNSDFNYQDYRIAIDDILKIDIILESTQLSELYNSSSTNATINKESMLLNGYQVDTDGNINLPSVGKLMVVGKTLKELNTTISKYLIEKKVLNNPTIQIKVLNLHFTVLGEVNNPGRYEYLSNNLNILEAIGMAGDLTINGKRTDISIIRDSNGIKTIYDIDLTKSDFLNKETFQIVSGDIILVNPNTTRVKNAGIIGNSGTLLSLLSFVLSSIIVISSN